MRNNESENPSAHEILLTPEALAIEADHLEVYLNTVDLKINKAAMIDKLAKMEPHKATQWLYDTMSGISSASGKTEQEEVARKHLSELGLEVE